MIAIIAVSLIMILAFTAFTVDVGYITVTKSQLQNAADGAALASGMELLAGFGPGASLNASTLDSTARQAAVTVSAANRAGDVAAAYCDATRDVRFGLYQWSGGAWTKNWGVTPYNMAEVKLHRDQSGGGGDRPLPLFFAPVIGTQTAKLSSVATAALIPGVGFRIKPVGSQNVGVLPIALDVATWNSLMAGVGTDNFAYDPATHQVTAGQDGILEVNLYPTGSNLLPPGNRGTVDIGSSNNSTSDLTRQILYGLNAYDMSFFGGEFRYDQVPLQLNGDTGLSAAIKAPLDAIKGQVRAIPIFSSVSGPGNNAMYTIVKFVGIRVLDTQLTGSPSQKHLTVQPAPFVDSTVIPGNVAVTKDSIFSPITLVR